MDQVLTITEAAALLRVHHVTVRRMIQRGELQAQRIGWVYRIPRSEVERYLIATRRGNGPGAS